jgi:hypothetical protein
MTTKPELPNPVWLGDIPGYTVTQMHDYAARVCAEKDAEIERLRMALRSATYLIDENELTCHNLSHNTKTFHEWDEPCPVEAMAKQRFESITAALGEKE